MHARALYLRAIGHYEMRHDGSLLRLSDEDTRMTVEELIERTNRGRSYRYQIVHLFRHNGSGSYVRLEPRQWINSFNVADGDVLDSCASPDVLAVLAEVHRLYENGEIELKLVWEDRDAQGRPTLVPMSFIIFDGRAGGGTAPPEVERLIHYHGGKINKNRVAGNAGVIYLNEAHAEAARRFATRGGPAMSVAEFYQYVRDAQAVQIGHHEELCWSLRNMRNWLKDQQSPLPSSPLAAIKELVKHHGGPDGAYKEVPGHIRLRLLEDLERLRQRNAAANAGGGGGGGPGGGPGGGGGGPGGRRDDQVMDDIMNTFEAKSQAYRAKGQGKKGIPWQNAKKSVADAKARGIILRSGQDALNIGLKYIGPAISRAIDELLAMPHGAAANAARSNGTVLRGTSAALSSEAITEYIHELYAAHNGIGVGSGGGGAHGSPATEPRTRRPSPPTSNSSGKRPAAAAAVDDDDVVTLHSEEEDDDDVAQKPARRPRLCLFDNDVTAAAAAVDLTEDGAAGSSSAAAIEIDDDDDEALRAAIAASMAVAQVPPASRDEEEEQLRLAIAASLA